MFERFTEQARRVVVLAQEEARGSQHNYIGAEHLLLGLIAGDDDSVALTALRSLDVSPDLVRARVQERFPQGSDRLGSHVPFTPEAKLALEGSLRESIELGDDVIDCEHLLLGLLRSDDSPLGAIMEALGAGHEAVRAAVAAVGVRRSSAPQARRARLTLGSRTCLFCGRRRPDVPVVTGPRGAAICKDCVAKVAQLLAAPETGGQA